MLAWEMLFHIGWVVLGLALAYGLWKYYTRNKANDAVTEQATREQYEHPESYDNARREELKDKLRPS
ncbi:MAG TPA: hypothetical protein VEA44_19085 [Caulobacter sp.]|nr:hypothetical protein [Caulobacter sp.]